MDQVKSDQTSEVASQLMSSQITSSQRTSIDAKEAEPSLQHNEEQLSGQSNVNDGKILSGTDVHQSKVISPNGDEEQMGRTKEKVSKDESKLFDNDSKEESAFSKVQSKPKNFQLGRDIGKNLEST